MALTQLLTYFPKLSELCLFHCKKVTGLGVNVKRQRATETHGPSSSTNINKVKQQQGARAENEVIVASEEAEGLLLLPPQLQELEIYCCLEMSLLCFNPHDDSNEEDGRTRLGGGGLQGLTSLRLLEIHICPELLSAYSSSSFSSSFPFPNSLEHLTIDGAVGGGAQLPLSNLTSLKSLSLWEYGDLRGEGLLSLLAQGHLAELHLRKMPNLIVDSEPPWMPEQELPTRSSKVQNLQIEDVAGSTAAAIRRSLHFSSLTILRISENIVERFTEEQEALLFVNSLEEITFSDCDNLQSLPARLHRLPNLKRLNIRSCEAIQMLPEDGLPSSLEELVITGCLKICSLPKNCLPDSLQKLEIRNCSAIQSLPEVDDLPSSLRELDVCDELYCNGTNSEELRNQCHRFINIIPVVRI